MRCRQDDCGRRTSTSGWCSSHYRRWRSGQSLDTPIRRYERVRGDTDGSVSPVQARTRKPRREKPFAAERALLRELGLQDY